jgi:hypothetical protein
MGMPISRFAVTHSMQRRSDAFDTLAVPFLTLEEQ